MLIPEEENDACFFLLCQVCKYYLCGFCPAELFTNTRSDLGKSGNLVLLFTYILQFDFCLQARLLLPNGLPKHFENRVFESAF